MNAILCLTLLAAWPGDVSVVTPAEAHARLGAQVQTGTLIFCRGDCLAVKIYSASRTTHVATVVLHDGCAYCYDATGGAGVRKQTLAAFLASQHEAALYPYHPHKPLSKQKAQRLEAHLESQLGRSYAIAHHLTGDRADGLHCSEYATDALIAGGLLRAREPSRVSPASLREGVARSGLYDEAETLQLAPEPSDPYEDLSWCASLWFGTQRCTYLCYRKLRAWFCCK